MTCAGFWRTLKQVAMAAFRRWSCNHEEVRFIRNVYGDEIFHKRGKRSVWRCEGCGSYAHHDRLYHQTHVGNN